MKRAAAVVLLGVGTMITGCYHIGPLLKANYRTVAVVMFKNRTLKPQIEAQITNATIKQFQIDGVLRVVTAAEADVVMTGEITEYIRHEVRSARQDTGEPREYEVSIVMKLDARDQHSGQIIVKSTVLKGKAATFIGSDLQTADQQVLPLVADDLGRQAARLLTESW